MNAVNSFGPKLRKIRNERGLSQEALARELGVSWMTISRYERGKSTPTMRGLRTLADLLEVGIDDLFGEDVAA